MIDKVIESGEALIAGGHFASVTIRENCQELSLTWTQLLDAMDEREERLNTAFEAQQVGSQNVLSIENVLSTVA